MAKEVDKSKLGYLGLDFQFRLTKSFIEDQKFFMRLSQMVDQNMFTDENLRRIIGYMKDRYEQAGVVPGYRDLELLIRSKISDMTNLERNIATLNKIRTYDIDNTGIDITQNLAEQFFKQQNLTKALNEAQNIIKLGDLSQYNKIEDIIKKALEVGDNDDLGSKVFDDMETTLSEDYRCAIPTGASELDKALYGGLGRGELGVIIAPSSVGKTSATTGFAANAAVTLTEDNNYQGYKVAHFHFEDKIVDIRRKYYAYVTDIDACELSLPGVREVAKDILQQNNLKELIQKNIRLFRPLSGEYSASDIKAKLKQLIASGFKPDLVIVDYFECLKLENGSRDDKEYAREGITMRKLESIAHDFDVALWCPVQGTKDSFNQQIVSMSQAGGSVKKVQIGHVIISFARTDEMRLHSKINIFISKFRPGRIKVDQFLNVTFNNGTTKFDFSTMNDVDEALDNNGNDYQQKIARNVKQNF